MAEVVRFGLVGTGVAGETHARELKRVEGARLEAVLGRDATRTSAFAARLDIPRSFARYIDLLADPAIDAVIIATPNGQHLDYAVQAARAGKHVVVEKPLEITEQRAQTIVDACREAGRRLFVIYQRRYSQAARQALSDIDAGRLGDIVLVNIVDNEFRTPSYYARDAWRGTWAEEGGGCVMTQSTHMLDLAQHLVGPIVRVFAQTRTAYHAIETEDVAVAALTFACGALGTFSSSTAAFPGQRHLLMISGTRGSIILNAEHDQIVFRRTVEDATATAIPPDFSFADPTEPRDYPTEGQRRQLQAIVDEIRGVGSLAVSNEPGLWATRVIDAIYHSAREGRSIDIAHGEALQTHAGAGAGPEL